MGSSDCPCNWPLERMTWASILGRCRGPGRLIGPTFSLGLASGPACLFLNPISFPPALVYGERVQGLYRFLNRMRLPRVCSRLVWLRLYRRHMPCVNDDFSVFASISSSSFSFFMRISSDHSSCVPLILKPFCFSGVQVSLSLTFALIFHAELLLAFCDTLPEVAFFFLFMGRVCLSSFFVFSGNIARR